MAAAAIQIGYMASEPGLTANVLDKDISISQHSVDEDDSSLSSSGTEVFDRSSSGPSHSRDVQLDGDGNRQRYHSSESAISTGISSMCSSVAAEDAPAKNENQLSPSRKRMNDGTLKTSFPSVKLDTDASYSIVTETIKEPIPESQAPPKKKRGRPPKIRPPVTDIEESPKPAAKSSPKVPRALKLSKPDIPIRPRFSIPSQLSAEVFGSQCIKAADDSRLDPYSLHPGENRLLESTLMTKEITVYLNIRNAILRLWHHNPIISVTLEEASGCAKDSRYFGLAEVAYRWLTRNGYINFGCVQPPKDRELPKRYPKDTKQRTVLVIGAGVSGLTTARQLESQFKHEAAKWITMGERPPRVIVLEGRKRIGGRVYSKPFRSQVTNSLPNKLRNTAEMGAMIVTGFENGNPLDTVIRGQLGLRYHLMKDALTIYDCDGGAVEETRDTLNTQLYTDISDRAGEFRVEPQRPKTLRGDEDLIDRCKDPPPSNANLSAWELEPLPASHIRQHKPATRRGRRRNAPPGTEKLTGRGEVVEGESATVSASRAVKNMGWQVRDGVARNQSISLGRIANAGDYPTLGTVMDDAITQYQNLIDLTPLDMRLLNWHHANLEYANAAPVSSLSLSGHDQDTGNEFEGAHSEIIGGYTQVPRGLSSLPTKLDVRIDRIVESIHYDAGDKSSEDITTKVVCTDGEVFEADQVVVTTPLGVLKSGTVDFDPPLPHWKRGAIDRMGFGLLNKVILLYDKPFWDDDRDMFGLLNEAEIYGSLDTSDYSRKRGRFYLIWNATRISGRPVLVALMAGNAAEDAEWTDTSTLMNEVSGRLRGVFPSADIPSPLEVIVTRWRRDPFTRGTYSYVGPETRPGDYDLMARPVGNVHFAGEATCGTHPATVHGAFLSGLRVAADVIDSMVGPITLPDPLIAAGAVKDDDGKGWAPAVPPVVRQPPPSPPVYHNVYGTPSLNFASPQPTIKQEEHDTPNAQSAPVPIAPPFERKPSAPPFERKPSGPPARSVCPGDPSFWVSANFEGSNFSYEECVQAVIQSELGDRPLKPGRPGVNSFLLFTKDKWDECKAQCSRENINSGRDVIRQTIGKWWKAADDSVKQPYVTQAQLAQDQADAQRKQWETDVVQWDQDAAKLRQEYMEKHPPPTGSGTGGESSNVGVSKRRTNTSNCIVLDHL